MRAVDAWMRWLWASVPTWFTQNVFCFKTFKRFRVSAIVDVWRWRCSNFTHRLFHAPSFVERAMRPSHFCIFILIMNGLNMDWHTRASLELSTIISSGYAHCTLHMRHARHHVFQIESIKSCFFEYVHRSDKIKISPMNVENDQNYRSSGMPKVSWTNID